MYICGDHYAGHFRADENKMADLGSSLTKMDWLHRIRVGGPVVASGINGSQGTTDAFGRLSGQGDNRGSADSTGNVDNSGLSHQRDGKPPYSYANLIMHAINSTSKKRMTLSEIYAWICENFPYYKKVGNGWKVRTLLSPSFVCLPCKM